MTTIWITCPEPLPIEIVDQLTDDLGTRPEIGNARRGIDPIAVDVVFATAVAMFIHGLVEQFGAQAADRLSRAVGRLRGRTPASSGSVRLIDDVSGVVVIIDDDASSDDRAVKELLGLVLPAYQFGVELRWDAGSGRWQPQVPL